MSKSKLTVMSDASRLLAELQKDGVEHQHETLERQCVALDKFFALPSTSVSESDRRAMLIAGMKALETSIRPYFIAERLLRFRKDVIAPATELLNRNPACELTILAALLLTNNGSRLGVPVLIAEIECGGEYVSIAARALANAEISDHAPAVVMRLRQTPLPPLRRIPDIKDDLILLDLIDILTKIHTPLPEDLRGKFSSPLASEWFRSAVSENRACTK